MEHLLVQLTNYLNIFLILIYTYNCFSIFRHSDNTIKQKSIYILQRMIIFLINFCCFFVLYITTDNIQIIGFYLMQFIVLLSIIIMYHLFYNTASELVLNNMVMLLSIGLITLCRLSMNKAVKQLIFMVVGFGAALIIPLVLQKISVFRKLTWLYAAVGIFLLLVVAVLGATSYGAKLSISIAGISVQPSEFVKIIFVFYIASMMYKSTDLKQLAITSVVSACFVLILVASRDLGGALLYFFTYLVMVYVATRKLYIFAGGIAFMSIAAILGYNLFSHVQTRFIAWKDPLSVIDNQGYQVCQSLFAIGTGGWFGLGLNQGLPKKIPVVENDFIFSAISEEFGGIFALCIIMICISCFFMIFNISMQLKDSFYKMVALGLGSVYALQVFLTIGGVIKFIPSTGVTLPLVSYGGSSLLATMIIFGIVQALYIMQSKTQEGASLDGSKKQKENLKK